MTDSTTTAAAPRGEVNFRCRRCGQGLWLRSLAVTEPAACSRCSELHDVDASTAFDSQGRLTQCVVCGCDRLYQQRDFNRKLGLGIVALAALFSVKTYGLSLVVAAIIDLGLYLGLPQIALCYHCEAIHRGMPRSDEIEGYDLATHERYENREWGKGSPAT